MVKIILCPLLFQQAHSYTLSIGSVFKNEGRFLKEWIEYHRLVGVEHFYLFNNHSDDDYLTTLQPYIDSGVVDLFEFPIECTDVDKHLAFQTSSYNIAVGVAKKESKWLAIIDLDEFIVPIYENTITEVLADYEEYGGLVVNWQLFGTSNVYEVPKDKTMVETLLLKAPADYAENGFIKSIVRPTRVANCHDAHIMTYKKGFFSVNTERMRIYQSINPVIIGRLQINHYWTKDEKFLYEVKIPRRNGWQEGLDGILNRAARINKEVDTTIQRFVPALRKRLGYP